MLFFTFSFGQSNKKKTEVYESVYAKEFKQLKKTVYNTTLFSLSNVVPKKNWKGYKGGAINTEKSLFYFNNDFLAISFPTNADKIRNQYLAFYFSQKSAKCPTLFSLLNYYEPVIEKELNANKLPKELKLLPAVCSAFNPSSSNGTGGEGFWHINYPQAIKYGLTVNELVDERRDFEKATKAAAHYIKDLHEMYNDWELTLTAYSSGVVTVNKLLQRHSAKTYKAIYPHLPSETKDFVQAFVAMNYIYKYDTYGAVNLNPNIEADTILIEKKLVFNAINPILKTTTKAFKFLNPTLNQKTFPSNYIAYFPKGMAANFLKLKDSIYFYQDSVMLKPNIEPKIITHKDGKPLVYKVMPGDVLGVIAERYHVKISQLKKWNNLRGNRINVGQKLKIFNLQPSANSHQGLNTKHQIPKTKHQTQSFSTHTVKSGESLWLIAKKFPGVSAQNIRDLNKIDDNLKVGQVLKIPKR